MVVRESIEAMMKRLSESMRAQLSSKEGPIRPANSIFEYANGHIMYSPEMTELLIMGMPGDDRSQKLDALLDMLDREMQALNHPRGFTAGYVRNPHRSLDPKRQFVIAFVYIAVK